MLYCDGVCGWRSRKFARQKKYNFYELGKIAYEDTLKLIRGICQGLAYLHSKGVLHRDIKPQNILLKGNQPKIADFGFAIKSSIAIKERYSIGSPLYMSP